MTVPTPIILGNSPFFRKPMLLRGMGRRHLTFTEEAVPC
jgi:hypothetical protein